MAKSAYKFLLVGEINQQNVIEDYIQSSKGQHSTDFIFKPIHPFLLNERLNFLTSFFGNVQYMGFLSHELKAPLTAIRGYSSVLLTPMADTVPEDSKKQFYKIINNNAERLADTIDDLADIARIEANLYTINPIPVQINLIIDPVIKKLSQKFEDKNQTFLVEVPADLPPVSGNDYQITKVINALLLNAHNHTHEHGTIKFSAILLPEQKSVMFSVQDSGQGYSETMQKSIFSKQSFGLYIARSIVELHNGRMWFESEEGKGSTFYFTVPIVESF